MATPIFTAPDPQELIDAVDATHSALIKVRALLCMTYGNSGEAFRSMCGEYQDSFLWAISDLVDNAVAGFETVCEARDRAASPATSN